MDFVLSILWQIALATMMLSILFLPFKYRQMDKVPKEQQRIYAQATWLLGGLAMICLFIIESQFEATNSHIVALAGTLLMLPFMPLLEYGKLRFPQAYRRVSLFIDPYDRWHHSTGS